MLNLVGAWRLTSSYFVAVETGDRRDILGAEPFGYVVFEPNGRMLVFMTSAGRTPAQSSSGMAALFQSMVAYTGKWSIDGEKFATQVDGAWDPSWVGTEQVRYYTFDGQTLSLRTAPIEHPAFPGQKVIGYVDWRRDGPQR
jgi:Lipocalin-like domain